jgi:hypothetical protein
MTGIYINDIEVSEEQAQYVVEQMAQRLPDLVDLDDTLMLSIEVKCILEEKYTCFVKPQSPTAEQPSAPDFNAEELYAARVRADYQVLLTYVMDRILSEASSPSPSGLS